MDAKDSYDKGDLSLHGTGTNDGSIEAGEALDTYVGDKALEKGLLRKLDLVILPTLALMYLFNSIDKSNLGNAETDGLSKDLHMTGDQYNILLSVFYVPFVLTGPPMNLLTKKFGAKERCLHLATCLVITCIGFIILAAVDVANNIAVGYFACFLLCCGGFIVSPLLATWYTNNLPDENQRAILTPVLVGTANAMGLVSSNIFRPKDAPNYVPASVISACFAGAAAIITIGVGLYMKFDNRKRNKRQGVSLKAGDVPTSSLRPPYQKDLNWRWMGGIR